jgi:uncharacterized pyridoxal phosphate-containing UPF0001 family protein
MPILLEVNLTGEASKYGFVVSEEPAVQNDQFMNAVAEISALPSLDVQGLMTMAPFGAPEQVLRSCFSGLRYLRETLRSRFPKIEWRHLSMGMTDDFEIAIEEGATMIRIGRAIFGERDVQQEDHP